MALGPALLVSKDAANATTLKVHGKWCGPGHGFKGRPKDAVDAVCRLHDICCRRKGYGDPAEKIQHCKCDRIIVRRMPSAIRRVRSSKGRVAGASIYAYFRNAPCWCKKRICITLPRCRKVRRCKTVRKRICARTPRCRRVRKCKRIFGKRICKKIVRCRRVRKCKTIRKRLCVKVPKCRKVKKCTRKKVFGRGGRCP